MKIAYHRNQGRPPQVRTVSLAVASAVIASMLLAPPAWGRTEAANAGGDNEAVATEAGGAPANGAAAGAGARTAVEPDDATEAIVAGVAGRAVELLSEYISQDTTNPPGAELAGARFLARVLEDEGLSAQIFESAPGRANLYARLPGNGSKKALVLLSHIDVVPVDEDRWDHPPLRPELADGLLYGRGVLDCKGPGIIQALATVAVSKLGGERNRDVILLATADEEEGGALGAGWMLENHPDLFENVDFVLNEGGFINRVEGKPLMYNLNAAEKGPCWFKITARGEPGHGSRPGRETSVTRLIEALHELLAWKRPYEVGPVVAGYYAAYSELEEDRARQLRQLARALEDSDFYQWFTSEPSWDALIRDTISVDVLRAAPKTNIIPAEASAEVDARLLPEHSCDAFLSEVSARIGSPYISIEKSSVAFPASQSPLDSSLVHAIERLAESEDAVVLPGLLTGFTDNHYFREKGIDAYGFVPLVVGAEERKTVHAPNERVAVSELEAAVARMVELLRIVDR